MKRTILTMAITAFLAGAMLTGCQSSADKIENAEAKVREAQDKVVLANQELDQALKDSIQQFRKESEAELASNEKSIAEFKVKIAKERKENRAMYEKRMAELDQQNREMRRNLEEFNDVQRDKWESFRIRFKHDMDEHATAMKNFWTGSR